VLFRSATPKNEVRLSLECKATCECFTMASPPPAKRRRHPSLIPLLNQVTRMAGRNPVSCDRELMTSSDTSKTLNNHSSDFFSASSLAQLPTQGLAKFDSETLRQYVDPIWRSLKNLDAETMLSLQRMEYGARLNDSEFVRPIHDEITPCRSDRGSGVVRYLHVSEIPEKYSIGIFVFPPHTRIPLHDHPGMCVLSRVLYGDLERTSMDLVEDTRSSWLNMLFTSSHKRSQKAAMLRQDHLQAPDITMLFPHEGNLHEFVAGEHGAAVLDVLLPPYSGDSERECTFYKIQEDSGGIYSILPTGQPEDFHCLSGSYRDLGEV